MESNDNKADYETGNRELLDGEQRKNMSDSAAPNITQDPMNPTKHPDFKDVEIEHHFDLSISEIIKRYLRSMIPFNCSSMFNGEKPDALGPFILYLTMSVLLVVYGFICVKINKKYGDDTESNIGMTKIICLFVYFPIYLFIWPFLIGCQLQCWLGDRFYGYITILSTLGYSFTLFVPTMFLFLIPNEIFRLSLFAIVGILSFHIVSKELVWAYMPKRRSLECCLQYALVGLLMNHIVILFFLQQFLFDSQYIISLNVADKVTE